MSCVLRLSALAAPLLALVAGGCDQRPPAAEQARAPLPAPVQLARTAQAAPDTALLGAGPSLLGHAPPPAPCGIKALPEDVLRRINAARAAGRSCGGRAMAPAAPLKWDISLQTAATVHSADMAQRNYFDHRSPDGRDVGQRAQASGYPWGRVGENIAGGDSSVQGVVQNWLESPDHCSNIMEPRFEEVAVACAQQPGSQWGTYWTMVLGRRR